MFFKENELRRYIISKYFNSWKMENKKIKEYSQVELDKMTDKEFCLLAMDFNNIGDFNE